MARIAIDLPDKFLFSTSIAVRVSDLNYGGHVGNDSILTIMQDARILFYRKLGYQNEISFDGPVGQIIADSAVQYKSEAFLGDVLVIAIGVGEFWKCGFDLFYLITEEKTGRVVAKGKTGIVCFDYSVHKKAHIPESLKQKLNPIGDDTTTSTENS
jgi:acyl-CoA thioester hydrolase